jgi:MoxR-like ATPase
VNVHEHRTRLFRPDGSTTEFQSVKAWSAHRLDEPAGYVVPADLSNAINASLLLGQPLLLTGESGVGKTSVGRMVAYALDLPLLEFTVKSTSRSVDLFYEYDAIGRFQSIETQRAEASRLTALASLGAALPQIDVDAIRASSGSLRKDPRKELLQFIKVRALGRAILNASTREEAALLLADDIDHAALGLKYERRIDGTSGWVEGRWSTAPVQSVVIIDEIDKAPLDFCNDLLDELEHMRFQVPELATLSTSADAPRFGGSFPSGLRPLVFITSNQEKPLPDAFLRRCCFYHIEMPAGEALDSVINSRLGASAGLGRPELDALLGIFSALQSLPLSKRPGLAELLSWLRYLKYLKESWSASTDEKHMLIQSLPTLMKNSDDIRQATAWLETRPTASRPG